MPDRPTSIHLPDPHRPAAHIHVVLVEDDTDFIDAFRAAMSAAPDMRLVCVATTKAQALQALAQAPADVLLVDLGLPDGSGIDVISAARAHWPSCAIMVNTTFGDEVHVIRAIEAGANGYLLKDGTPKAMMEEVRVLHRGGSPISPLIARQMLMRFRQDAPPAAMAAPPEHSAQPASPLPADAGMVALSAREQEVLQFITKGFTYDEIAKLMLVSRYTVMTFVRRIYAKLQVKSKAEAIYEARIHGLLAD